MSAATRHALEMAEKAKQVLASRVAVPDAPRSAFAFEQACNTLRKQQQAPVFAAYLKKVTIKTLKRLYRGRGVDSEALGAIIGAGVPALIEAYVAPRRVARRLQSGCATCGHEPRLGVGSAAHRAPRTWFVCMPESTALTRAPLPTCHSQRQACLHSQAAGAGVGVPWLQHGCAHDQQYGQSGA